METNLKQIAEEMGQDFKTEADLVDHLIIYIKGSAGPDDDWTAKSDFETRKRWAKAEGIEDYTNTVEQNVELFNKLRIPGTRPLEITNAYAHEQQHTRE